MESGLPAIVVMILFFLLFAPWLESRIPDEKVVLSAGVSSKTRQVIMPPFTRSIIKKNDANNQVNIDVSTDDTASGVSIGPDLNVSRGPLDKKLYRQIILPNGLRCVLIQDTLAMQQVVLNGGLLDVDELAAGDNNMSDSSNEVINGCNADRLRFHPKRSEGRVQYGSDDADFEAESIDEDDDGDDGTDDGAKNEDDGGIRDAAAAVLVGAGSFYDPHHCQGLAHFLEHLLFMGSTKYPGENEYESFVAKHGGSDNAYTEWDYTTYTLNIPQEYLWSALDRLAQFFISPLFKENSVDRELKSIESEFQLNLLSDANRWDQIFSTTSKINHPFNKFAWGNLKSLREIPSKLQVDPLQELRTFFSRYYYAANMRLVVIGAYTLDEMERNVVEQFSAVPKLPRDTTGPFQRVQPNLVPSWESPLYDSPIAAAGFPLDSDRGLCKIFRVIPVREKHTLSVSWQIPAVENQWQSKPADYISHLLGHEAAGSLLSFVRAKSLAVSCTVGVGDGGAERSSCHALFIATFVLSERGIVEWRSIVDALYQYIGMLRYYSLQPNGFPMYIFDELKSTHELSYRFRDEPSPDDVVDNIASDMAPHRNIPADRLLDGSSLLFDFDLPMIRTFLNDHLIPQNARIDILSTSFGKLSDYQSLKSNVTETETVIKNLIVSEENSNSLVFDSASVLPQIEPMFGTPFWCHNIPEEWLFSWTQLSLPKIPSIDIRLPPQNPFVPKQLDMKPLPEDDADHPLLHSSLKLCVTVGRAKQWFPATAIRYDRKQNSILLSYEDETEKWHILDTHLSQFPLSEEIHIDSFEDTLDKKEIRFRICSLALPGKGAIRLFGDESDYDAFEGVGYPAIPPPSSHLPKEICNTNTLKLWWLQDRTFKRPIADFRLQIICAKANATPLHRACSDLYRSLCVDALIETSYLAEMCELSTSFHPTETGFTLRIHGFDDNLLTLFESTMRLVLSFRNVCKNLPSGMKEDRFDACLEILKRSYKNAGLRGSGLAADLRIHALRPTLWSCNQLSKSLDKLTIPLFAATISEIYEEFAIEALYHGNVTRADAHGAKDLVLHLLENVGGTSLPRKRYPAQSVTKIPTTISPILISVPSKDAAEPNTSVEIYVQVGKDDIRDRTLMDLLIHIMHEPFFDQLRTKDQYGYSVYCSSRWSYGIVGCIFHITTNVKSAHQVMERVDKFLKEFRHDLAQMSKDTFIEHQVALAKEKLDMFSCMSDLTDSLWNEIREGRFEWEVWRNEAILLRSLKKEDILAVFDEWLNPDTSRKIFAIQVIGTGNNGSSVGRPQMGNMSVEDYCDDVVANFQTDDCKKQTCGRVNSKLF